MSDATPMPHRDHFAALARALVGEGRDWAMVHRALDEREPLARNDATAAVTPPDGTGDGRRGRQTQAGGVAEARPAGVTATRRGS